jgi:hypothetical protein
MGVIEENNPLICDSEGHGAACAALLVTLFAAASEGTQAAAFAFPSGLAASLFAFFGGAAILVCAALPSAFGIAFLLTREPVKVLRMSLVRGLTGRSDAHAAALLLILLILSATTLISATIGTILAGAVTLPFAVIGEAIVLTLSFVILLLCAAPVGHAVTKLIKKPNDQGQEFGVFFVLCGAAVATGLVITMSLSVEMMPTPTAAVLGAALSTVKASRRVAGNIISSRIGRIVIVSLFAASLMVFFFSSSLPGPAEHAIEQHAPTSGAILLFCRSF